MSIFAYHLVKPSGIPKGPFSQKTHIVFDERVRLETSGTHAGGTISRDRNQMLCSRFRYIKSPLRIEGSAPTCPRCLDFKNRSGLTQYKYLGKR